jgi:hypothetical protein
MATPSPVAFRNVRCAVSSSVGVAPLKRIVPSTDAHGTSTSSGVVRPGRHHDAGPQTRILVADREHRVRFR